MESFLDEVGTINQGESAEIMLHPAKGKNADTWRLNDLATLTNSKVIDYFTENEIELINYSQI